VNNAAASIAKAKQRQRGWEHGNGEHIRIWKESVVSYFNELFRPKIDWQVIFCTN
jgi:hypothetical protein